MNQMLTVTSCKIVGPVDLPSCTKLCLPNWQSDNSSTICKQCGSAFSIFNRRVKQKCKYSYLKLFFF